MGQVLHGCARTTAAVRRAIQHRQKSLNVLAEQYGVNPKTVAKWKKRSFANDAPMGPKEARSTVLTNEKEAAIVAFRTYTLLPLNDCLYALQPSIPHLTRSSLHRRPPADLRQNFRVSPPPAHRIVLTLEWAGFIRRQLRVDRGIEMRIDPEHFHFYADRPKLRGAGLAESRKDRALKRSCSFLRR
jgi:hypothetical protein